MSKRHKNSSQARRGETRPLETLDRDLEHAERENVRPEADNMRDRGHGHTDRKAKGHNERRR
jgi:hypothetical protein